MSGLTSGSKQAVRLKIRLEDMEINEIARRIESRVHFIDRVRIRFDRTMMSSIDLYYLKSLCHSVSLSKRSLQFSNSKKVLLDLRQPTISAIEYLAEIITKGYRFTYLEIAMDLLTSNQKNANNIDLFFRRHVVQPWHGNNRQTMNYSSCYWSKRKSNRNIVAYADRDSKIVPQPCEHIEWRFRGCKSITAAGILTFEDLYNLDHTRFWRKHLVLYRLPDAESIARAIRKSSHCFIRLTSRIPLNGVDDYYICAAKQFLYGCRLESSYPTAQNCIDLGKKFGVKNLMHPISNEFLLKIPEHPMHKITK